MEFYGRKKRGGSSGRPKILGAERTLIDSKFFIRRKTSEKILYTLRDTRLSFEFKNETIVSSDPDKLMDNLEKLPIEVQDFIFFNLDIIK